jgi:hypothetical protein
VVEYAGEEACWVAETDHGNLARGQTLDDVVDGYVGRPAY